MRVPYGCFKRGKNNSERTDVRWMAVCEIKVKVCVEDK